MTANPGTCTSTGLAARLPATGPPHAPPVSPSSSGVTFMIDLACAPQPTASVPEPRQDSRVPCPNPRIVSLAAGCLWSRAGHVICLPHLISQGVTHREAAVLGDCPRYLRLNH